MKKIFGYPAAVFFIVVNEFCERFSFYGMKTILIIYLTAYLKLDANTAVSLTHGFNMICYSMPLFGAILADSYLGKFRTIFYISIIYAIGNGVMSITAIPDVGGRQMWGPLLGLVLIGLGTGGIKPCVAAFGGDQFTENEGSKVDSFFSLFYFSINAGSVLSTFITPLLSKVQCLDEDTCYSLAFGTPAVLMLVAICIFLMGDCITKYNKKQPEGNIFGDVCRCVGYALKRSFRAESGESRHHWLDWADDKYSPQLISDIKAVKNVLIIFSPLVMFWALFEQQATRWTLQAVRMDGMGVILPEQMQIVNAFLILGFIPIFDKGIYPLLNKCGFAMRPLQRVGIGLLLTSTSFVVSGFLEVALEAEDLHPPASGFGAVSIINNLDSKISVSSPVFSQPNYEIPKHEILKRMTIKLKRNQTIVGEEVISTQYKSPTLTFQVEGNKYTKDVAITDRKGTIVVVDKYKNGTVVFLTKEEDILKPTDAKVWMNLMSVNSDLRVRISGDTEYKNMSLTILKKPGMYAIDKVVNGQVATKTDKQYYKNGGTYTIVFKDEPFQQEVYINTEPNKYSIFLQLPQYIIITMGEIMVSVTGLAFAYSQAPESMKAVLQSGWLLTTFCGNLIVLVVVEAQHGSESQLSHSAELFLFAGLCLICTFIFVFLATRYKYVNVADTTSDPGSVSKVAPEMELDDLNNGKVSNGKPNIGYMDDEL